MFRPLSIFIGTRYTRAKRRNRFVSFISMTSMIGLALGVLAMIVVLSVMNGFQREMSARILGLVPHAAILGVQPMDDWHKVADTALQNPAVMAAAPITEMEGMLSYKGAMQPIQVGGIDPAEEGKVSIVGQHIVQGRLQDLQPREFGVVIGELTARRFRLNTGDKLTLIVPEISKEPGGITPRMQRLTVVGIFKVGAELDGSQAYIHKVADAAMRDPAVMAAAPITEMEGMLSYKGAMQPIQVGGIDPAEEGKVSIVGQHIVQGRLQDLQPREFGVVIGELTARRFRLNTGDKLTLIVPEISKEPGGITPRMQRLTVVGIFKVGAELDGSQAYIHVDDAGAMQRWAPGQVQGVRLKLHDLYAAPQVSKAIAAGLGDAYRADDWSHTQGSLFSAMKMEKTMIGLLLLMIIAVAAFNIIATLVMVVNDKGPDIAILRTLGATPAQIMGTFMVQGSLIGIVGTLIGGVLGVVAAFNVSQIVGWLERVSGQHIFTSDVYFVSSLPSQLQWGDVAIICTAGLVMSFLATIYPAYRASQVQPAIGLAV